MKAHVKEINNPVTITDQHGNKVALFSHKTIMVQTLINNETLRIRDKGNLYTTDMFGKLTKVGETSLGKALSAK